MNIENQAIKYLSFIVNDEDYAIELSFIKEIHSFNSLTNIKNVASAPQYLKGIVYFEDAILTLIDMRLLYGFKEKLLNEYSVIIVLNVENTLLGLIVDAVCDIITIDPQQIKSPPDFVSLRHHHCVEGMGVIEGRMFILLDVPKMIQDKKLAFSEHLGVSYE